MNLKIKRERQSPSTDRKTRLVKFVGTVFFGLAIAAAVLAGLYLSTDRTDKENKAYVWFMLSGVTFAAACLILLRGGLRARVVRIDCLLHAEGDICGRQPFRSAAAWGILVTISCALWIILSQMGTYWFIEGRIFTAHVWFMLLGNIGILALSLAFLHPTKLQLEEIERHLASTTQSDGDNTADIEQSNSSEDNQSGDDTVEFGRPGVE